VIAFICRTHYMFCKFIF